MSWDKRFEDNPGRTSLQVYVVILIVLLISVWAISAATFGMRVATAGLVGRGEAHIQKESANNRIAQNSAFYAQYESIQKYDKQIKDAQKDLDDWVRENGNKLETSPLNTLSQRRAFLEETVKAFRNSCQTTATNYNTDAQAYISKDFRDANLPERIDLEVHCK